MQVNMELTSREEELVRLGQRARRLQAKGQEAKSRTVVSLLDDNWHLHDYSSSSRRQDTVKFHCEPLKLYSLRVKSYDYHVIGQVPELEELLSIPAEALQKELCLSREEVPEAKSRNTESYQVKILILSQSIIRLVITIDRPGWNVDNSDHLDNGRK